MTIRTGVGVRFYRNGWGHLHLFIHMTSRNGPRRICIRVPISRRNGKYSHCDCAPDEKRNGPTSREIRSRNPVELSFSSPALAFGKQRRWADHFSRFANSLVPKEIQRLVARESGGARLRCFLRFAFLNSEKPGGTQARITDIGATRDDANLEGNLDHQRTFGTVDLQDEGQHLNNVAGRKGFAFLYWPAV